MTEIDGHAALFMPFVVNRAAFLLKKDALGNDAARLRLR